MVVSHFLKLYYDLAHMDPWPGFQLGFAWVVHGEQIYLYSPKQVPVIFHQTSWLKPVTFYFSSIIALDLCGLDQAQRLSGQDYLRVSDICYG